MSKGLEALKRIALKDFILNDDSSLNDIKIIKKELEALEIIKSIKGLIEKEDLFYDIEENKYYFFANEISKDKYDLLKEVLL